MPFQQLIISLTLLIGLAHSSAVRADNIFAKPSAQLAEPLAVDQAFIVNGASQKSRLVEISWRIAPGYYLYKKSFSVRVDTPSAYPVSKLILAKGEKKHDAEFGDVEVYHNAASVRFHVNNKLPAPKTLRIQYQGCSEAGLCYPPQTKIIALK